MKRLLLLFGPLLALAGSLGLLLYGSAIGETLLILTYRLGTPTASLETMLLNVQLVILFVYMLMVGLLLAVVALPFPGQPQYSTITGKLLGCLAGFVLMGAAYQAGNVVLGLQHALKNMSTDPAKLNQAALQQIVDTASSDLEPGSVLFIVACALLLVTGLIGFRPGEARRLSSGTKIVISLLFVTLIAIGIVGASGILWYTVDQVMYLVTDINSPAPPAVIGSHLSIAFQTGAVLYAGLGGLGFVCLFSYLLTPRFRRQPVKSDPAEMT
ncbi:hypothetical protein DTL42_24070 [Bremerella cremea]|uniref:Uncharacterized protein n=1 Tax=Bremerella cremea TaxID=1031537 RepID=A0A368KLG4_9BACT|nr:hypothetical protein [Bremerella cremea]RCS40457.1 hypothetical protein DTL42_24070 [Bremerella cremea]